MSSKELSITMSFGIVTLSNEEPIEDILKRADELLYVAKENGRDRIEVETQSPPEP
jgi:PleD family two-component response regulator